MKHRRLQGKSAKKLEILFAAALAVPGLAVTRSVAAQSVTETPILSLGYLNYSDSQKEVDGVGVDSPSIYFKIPLGSRTEIEGGFVYDSVSGASAFNLNSPPPQQQPSTPAPSITPMPPAVSSPPCRLSFAQVVSRASGSSPAPSAPATPSVPSQPKPPHSSSGSGSNSICHPVSSGGSQAPSTTPIPAVPPTSTPTVGEDNEDEHENEHENEDESKEDRRAKTSGSLLKSEESAANQFTEERKAGDLKITHYFDSFSLGTGVAYSTENDYDSVSGLVESRIWTPDKNTTFAFGASANFDSISSTIDPTLDKSKDVQSFFAGVTQVLSSNSIIQSNVTYSHDNGYLSDPYRPGDDRPETRGSFAWLTRYNYYLESLDAPLHLDYRFYRDSWGVMSHMIETALYQPIGERLTLRPSIRFYSQGAADFYSYDGSQLAGEDYFSADQRLASFGGITGGVKVILKLADTFSANASVDYLDQSSSLSLGSHGGTEKRDSLDALFFMVGLTKTF